MKVTAVPCGSGNGSIIEDTTDHSTHVASSSSPLMEVAVLKEGECSQYKQQGQFGIPFDDTFFTIFQFRSLSLESTAFMFDYYLEERPGEIPLFIGNSHVLPSNLQDNFGTATLPITSSKHLPIGQLRGKVFLKLPTYLFLFLIYSYLE